MPRLRRGSSRRPGYDQSPEAPGGPSPVRGSPGSGMRRTPLSLLDVYASYSAFVPVLSRYSSHARNSPSSSQPGQLKNSSKMITEPASNRGPTRVSTVTADE